MAQEVRLLLCRSGPATSGLRWPTRHMPINFGQFAILGSSCVAPPQGGHNSWHINFVVSRRPSQRGYRHLLLHSPPRDEQHMKFNDCVIIYIHIDVIIIDKATNLQFPHGVGIEDYENWY